MASSRKRYTAYGRPLPRLAEPPRRQPLDTDFNVQQQMLIEALLAQVYDDLLVPGMYAEVCLTFTIHDGKISREIYTERREQHRLPEEEQR
jgi:hypothetical protein